MTKAEIVKQIAGQMGLESKMVAGVVEALLERIRAAQIGGQNVYFRGFGSFVRRERAAKKPAALSVETVKSKYSPELSLFFPVVSVVGRALLIDITLLLSV